MIRRTHAAEAQRALDDAQFDYAWKWFSFHAEQRTKMFNYMLLGIGLVATAIGGALGAKLPVIAAVLSFVAAIVANVFFLIDGRNRRLYDVALRVLIAQEGARLFRSASGDVRRAIASRIQAEDADAARGPWVDDLLRGRHRVWMPFIILGFGAMFAVIGGVLVLAAARGDEAQARPAAASAAACCAPGCGVCVASPGGSASDAASAPIADKQQAASRSTGVTTVVIAALLAGLGLTVWAWRRLFRQGAGEQVAAVAAAPRASPSTPSPPLSESPSPSSPSSKTYDVTSADEADRVRHTKGGLALASGGALLAWSVLAWLIDGGTLRVNLAMPTADRCAVVACCGEDRRCPIGDPPRAQPMVLRAERFASFERGSAALDCFGPAHRSAIASVREAIRRAHGDGQDALVMLVGGTDREALSAPLRRRYESNTGLARARVNAVEHCLSLSELVGPSGRATEAVRVVSGPGYTPDGHTDSAEVLAQTAEDREVRAFVFGVSTRRGGAAPGVGKP